MSTMRVLKPFHYANRQMQVGEVFVASPRDVRLLAALRRAEHVATPESVQPEEPVPDEVVESIEDLPPEPAEEAEKPRKKRKYIRRDLTSEG
jgi:hypothetical protein